MKAKQIVCNYSVIRFMPYVDTCEFVNVGILATCPQIGWFQYKIEKKKTKRVGDFFPELDKDIYKHALNRLCESLAPLRTHDEEQMQFATEQVYLNNIFKEIIRPREELLRFSEPATMLTSNPAQDLKYLYNHYVERHFAKTTEYQEELMQKSIRTLLSANNLIQRYKNEKIGNETYKLSLPFVEQADVPNRAPLKAIKALNLDKKDPTEIYNHGDVWLSKIKRITSVGFKPEKMLFIINEPTESTKREIANEICRELNNSGCETLCKNDQERILDFAR